MNHFHMTIMHLDYTPLKKMHSRGKLETMVMQNLKG